MTWGIVPPRASVVVLELCIWAHVLADWLKAGCLASVGLDQGLLSSLS
jgi:hypothetical protein